MNEVETTAALLHTLQGWAGHIVLRKAGMTLTVGSASNRRNLVRYKIVKVICVLATIAMLLADSAVSQATIIEVNIADDGDGGVVVTPYSGQQWQIEINGAQYWGPGHILGNVVTDSELDPTLSLLQGIQNNDTTGQSWSEYHITVTLNKPFTISDVTVGNTGWTWSIEAPIQSGTNFVGHIDYAGGTPVDFGNTINFSYSLNFSGSVNFTQELMPAYSVPEASTAALSIFGLLGLIAFRRAALLVI